MPVKSGIQIVFEAKQIARHEVFHELTRAHRE